MTVKIRISSNISFFCTFRKFSLIFFSKFKGVGLVNIDSVRMICLSRCFQRLDTIHKVPLTFSFADICFFLRIYSMTDVYKSSLSICSLTWRNNEFLFTSLCTEHWVNKVYLRGLRSYEKYIQRVYLRKKIENLKNHVNGK